MSVSCKMCWIVVRPKFLELGKEFLVEDDNFICDNILRSYWSGNKIVEESMFAARENLGKLMELISRVSKFKTDQNTSEVYSMHQNGNIFLDLLGWIKLGIDCMIFGRFGNVKVCWFYFFCQFNIAFVQICYVKILDGLVL